MRIENELGLRIKTAKGSGSTAVWHRLLKMLVLIARADDKDCQRFWSTAVWHRLLKMLVLIAGRPYPNCSMLRENKQ